MLMVLVVSRLRLAAAERQQRAGALIAIPWAAAAASLLTAFLVLSNTFAPVDPMADLI